MDAEERRPRTRATRSPRAASVDPALDALRSWLRARESPIVIGLGALLLVAVAQLREPAVPWLTWDSHVYWQTALSADLYADARVGDIGAFLYSPAFAQLIAPAGQLPWPAFLFGWAVLGIAVAVRLSAAPVASRHWLWLPVATVAIFDIGAGNINVLLAGAIVVGFRWPGAWSFLILTKVTPGLALVWFLVRREWSRFAAALGVTALVIGISATFEASAWLDWATMLLAQGNPHELTGDLAVPAHVRFPVALLLVAWGAVRDARWVVPIGVLLLMPVIWPNTLAMLIASATLASVPRAAAVGGEVRMSTEPATA